MTSMLDWGNILELVINRFKDCALFQKALISFSYASQISLSNNALCFQGKINDRFSYVMVDLTTLQNLIINDY
jgi:hypothetical protein